MASTPIKHSIGPQTYIPLIMLFTGSAIAATTLLLRTSRFASIENRTDRLGPELYSELAPALPMERFLLIAGVVVALASLVFLVVTSMRASKRGRPLNPTA
ncbi:hypothetical protein [Arthrobacter sp. M4]|uniref:hypothetical protein n=1 Tax=Arthrobacter sp. M4 TaxID=218160 RepID=UPI001CDB7D8C|nr:hypothetical protein [Arthrobacter sp. M4]MCA4133027.1 hypothetical protein [Arthrobacter sp. M4]